MATAAAAVPGSRKRSRFFKSGSGDSSSDEYDKSSDDSTSEDSDGDSDHDREMKRERVSSSKKEQERKKKQEASFVEKKTKPNKIPHFNWKSMPGRELWPRPPVPDFDAKTDDLHFQLTDLDYFNDADHFAMVRKSLAVTDSKTGDKLSTNKKDPVMVPIMRLSGNTFAGNSIWVFIHGFLPFFYIETIEHVSATRFRHDLEREIQTDVDSRSKFNHSDSTPRWTPNALTDRPFSVGTKSRQEEREDKKNNWKTKLEAPFVLQVEQVQKQSIDGYVPPNAKTGSYTHAFWKVTLAVPELVPVCRRLLETEGVRVHWQDKYTHERKSQLVVKIMTFETNVLFILRFLVEKQMSGTSWLRLPKGTYWLDKQENRLSRAQIEVHQHWNDLQVEPLEGKFSGIAPTRSVFLDIECTNNEGHFPKASRDPIVMIANIASEEDGKGGKSKDQAVMFALGTYNTSKLKTHPMALEMPMYLHAFDNEPTLLYAQSVFMCKYDPDVLGGYNQINFDLPYMLDRIKALKIIYAHDPYALSLLRDAAEMGRLLGEYSRYRETKMESKAFGNMDSKKIYMPGRVLLDALVCLRRDTMVRLASLKLDNVAFELLGLRKDGVHHSNIPVLHAGTPEDRMILAFYCFMDAWLSKKIAEKEQMAISTIEMARVTGPPPSLLLTSGQQKKGYTLILSTIHRKGSYVVPTVRTDVNNTKYQGATVIECKSGFYAVPVAVLDFVSLYPSVMVSGNLCYSTHIVDPHVRKSMDRDDYMISPFGTNHAFVKSRVREGVLVQILRYLLKARKDTQAKMKAFPKGSHEWNVLNKRQTQYKLACNSLYGFTAANTLPRREIAETVTAYGRLMINLAKETVEEEFTIANGYEHDVVVVYGDTDSIFVLFGNKDHDKVKEYSHKAEKLINERVRKYWMLHTGSPAEQIICRIEFEKFYDPVILFGAKMYSGLEWDPNDAKAEPKTASKGSKAVRREAPPLVKNALKFITETVLKERNIEKAVRYIQDLVYKLHHNEVDVFDLQMSVALNKKPEAYAQANVATELYKKLGANDKGAAPEVGDRFYYVVTQTGPAKTKVPGKRGWHKVKRCDKVQDPLVAMEQDIPIDTDYYITNQLTNPVNQFFAALIPDVSVLWVGHHAQSRLIDESKSGALDKFAKRHNRCVVPGCRTPVEEGKVLCDLPEHQERQAEMYIYLSEKSREKEKVASACRQQCVACTGERYNLTWINQFEQAQALVQQSPLTSTSKESKSLPRKKCQAEVVDIEDLDGPSSTAVTTKHTIASSAPERCAVRDCPIFYKRRRALDQYHRYQSQLTLFT